MSRGINGFQPSRLVQALAARRLSQIHLASMVGVSAPTISKWRSGLQAPEADALARLASVINVTPEWFTRQPSPKSSAPLFRSNASALATARAMLEARLEWAQDVAIGLSEFLDFPSVNLSIRDFTDPASITMGDIESAASECRERWGIGRGPVPDLALAVEGAGVILVREETGVAQIEGLSAWSYALDRPMVYLSADKDNAFRSRFDLAHELGHLILHKYIPRATERERHNLMEKQAHAFAGAFLLPAETFAHEVRTPVTLDSLLLLKQRWGVSVAAILMRLEALEIITAEEKQLLFKRRSARWGVKSEPGDEMRVPEKPRLLKRSIDLLLSSGVMTRQSIPQYMGLAEGDIETLACLPEGFFQGLGDVVELAKLRNSAPQSSGGISSTMSAGKVVTFSRKE